MRWGAQGSQKNNIFSVKGGWFEFCRVNYYGGVSCASVIRGISGFCAADLQHPLLRAGPEMMSTICSEFTMLWRRNGHFLSSRPSDMLKTMEFWGTSPAQFKAGLQSNSWMIAFLSKERGGYGCFSPQLPNLAVFGRVKQERVVVREEVKSHVLPRVVSRKLPHLSILNLSKYEKNMPVNSSLVRKLWT